MVMEMGAPRRKTSRKRSQSELKKFEKRPKRLARFSTRI